MASKSNYHSSSSQDMSIDDQLNLLLSNLGQIKFENQQYLNKIAKIAAEIVQFKEIWKSIFKLLQREINT